MAEPLRLERWCVEDLIHSMGLDLSEVSDCGCSKCDPEVFWWDDGPLLPVSHGGDDRG